MFNIIAQCRDRLQYTYKTKVHNTFFSTWYIGDYINSKEYRKPDWLVKMEALKEKLAGKTFVKKIYS